jgi:hypothetical protein
MPQVQRATKTVMYLPGAGGEPAGHERISHLCMTRRLADVLGLPFGGECNEVAPPPAGAGYIVPARTLSTAQAAACGIGGVDDVFGGVVPHDFAGTKIITHGLWRADATAPPGWCEAFPAAVRHVVLEGYSAFDPADLEQAAAALLRHGRVRVKQPGGIGGQGQQTIGSGAELARLVQALAEQGSTLAREGLVVERDLAEVATHSVGQVRVGGLCMSYCGSQRSTIDNRGGTVYGGSVLHCVRGDFDALDQFDPDPGTRLAIHQALTYHEAAQRCFPGIILSRANYDVAQGRDAGGRACSGVLEQSWRIGGASAAEIEAVAILLHQPSRRVVHALTSEIYGPHATAPPDAIVLFHGNDPHNGPLLKYAQVIAHADS